MNTNDTTIKYISDYMLQNIYKILKVNLTNDTFEIIRAREDELSSEKGYHPESFTAWINGFADSGQIYEEDIATYRMHVDVRFLNRFFSFTDALYRIRYRRKTDDGYRWVMMEMIPAKEYTDDNQIIILSVQDVDQDIVEMLETAKRDDMLNKLRTQYDTIKAIANIYISLHVIDLNINKITTFNIDENVKDFLDVSYSAREQIADTISKATVKDDIERALEFTNLDTLSQRLSGKKVISDEFISVKSGWYRLQFIANSFDDEGNVTSVLLTTQIIDEEKRREEMLIRISHTDELTQLYNRRSYEVDSEKYIDNIDDDLTVILMDVNSLKTTNDTLGHAAGDELITGAARCMRKVLGNSSSVYRTGGDEFVALCHYDPDRIEELKKALKEETSAWTGEIVKTLSIAIGYASHKAYPNASFEELEQTADAMMYEDKEKYYSENNIKRR